MSDDRPVIIAQISDLHCGSQYHIPSLATRVVDEVNELAPDALIVTGDLADMGFRQEFKVAQRLIARMEVKNVMVLPGNHDARNVGEMHFEEFFGPRSRELVFQGIHVLGLDSSEPDLDNGRVGRHQYLWIEERFSDPSEFKIVALHHHLLPVPGTGRERNIVYDAGDVLRVL
ncbi:MAG: metallophosphoesterase family protein, partial [Coriobacteriia bacterium]